MDAVNTAIDLGKYGTVGVMLALILLAAFSMYMLWKMATNHIEHSNDIFRENTSALAGLKEAIRELRRD